MDDVTAGSTTPDGGFTLVEVVVAMLVLTVALLALIPVQTRALAGVVLAQERQEASACASGAVERVRARALVPGSFSAIAAGSDPVLSTGTSCAAAGTAFSTSVSVTDPTPASAPALVTVTAVTSWTSRNAGAGVRQVTVRTLLADPRTP